MILMSEMALAERAQNIPRPDLSKIEPAKRWVYEGNNGYKRYEGHGLSAMPLPGGPGAYVANGSEHDDIGDTTHLPERHIQMTQRRFSKIALLEEEDYEREGTEHSIAVLPWGGSKGPAREAFDTLKQQGLPVAWYYTMYLNPVPPKLLEELKQKDLVIVPELNYQGQFSQILRGLGVKAESITQYTGLPFKARTLVDRISEMTNSRSTEAVTV